MLVQCPRGYDESLLSENIDVHWSQSLVLSLPCFDHDGLLRWTRREDSDQFHWSVLYWHVQTITQTLKTVKTAVYLTSYFKKSIPWILPVGEPPQYSLYVQKASCLGHRKYPGWLTQYQGSIHYLRQGGPVSISGSVVVLWSHFPTPANTGGPEVEGRQAGGGKKKPS